MELQGIQCHIKFRVHFTRKEVEMLLDMALGHYDGNCVAMARQGGLIYGMVNEAVHLGESATRDLTFHELDMLTKVAEQSQYRMQLDYARMFSDLLRFMETARALAAYPCKHPLNVRLGQGRTPLVTVKEHEPAD